MNYTDEQLKEALAKMLPNRLGINNEILVWSSCCQFEHEVLDTELLYLCWLVEETLTNLQKQKYGDILLPLHSSSLAVVNLRGLANVAHASWQQRVIALAKVKGIEI